jgi:ATP-dependent helicase Lhr and Lhr-like helicase
MSDPRLLLKARLPRTWPLFFARHGQFTEVQQRAIPPILEGQDTLVIAPTASGKTEAVIAPLLERHCCGHQGGDELRVLYICPTRALVRDLYERLAPPLQALHVRLSMKSGDTGPVSKSNPPTVLLTTPESTDSLLTRVPAMFASLRAVVLDEVHLFDRSPRGDHLRCLLARIERIRDYARQQEAIAAPGQSSLQRVALSATVGDPAEIATRYLPGAVVVQLEGGRELVAHIIPVRGLADVAVALGARGARKMLLFCNTRQEVEQVASYLRARLPYEAAIYAHYSNLDPQLRREVEEGFALSSVAVCVSSSTLELGIDIGSIDEVALLGAPLTATSFLQRAGRGGRRGTESHVLCLPRTARDEMYFNALLDLISGATWAASVPRPAYSFRLSVLAQQVFSLLKQSPTGAIRLADLRRIAPEEIEDGVLRAVLGHLSATGYLRAGRPGEWRPGPELDELLDREEIYSNIGSEQLGATVVDAYSGRSLAKTPRPHRRGETLLMGGRPVEVAWSSGNTFGVQRGQRDEVEEQLRFPAAPFAVPLELGQAVAAHLGLEQGQLPCLLDPEGAWLFHFWGEVYGELLAAVLQAHYPADAQGDAMPIHPWNEHCLWLPHALRQLPVWDHALAVQELRKLADRVEPYLEPGRFQAQLPRDLAREMIMQQCDLPFFAMLYHHAHVTPAPPALVERLQMLL